MTRGSDTDGLILEVPIVPTLPLGRELRSLRPCVLLPPAPLTATLTLLVTMSPTTFLGALLRAAHEIEADRTFCPLQSPGPSGVSVLALFASWFSETMF